MERLRKVVKNPSILYKLLPTSERRLNTLLAMDGPGQVFKGEANPPAPRLLPRPSALWFYSKAPSNYAYIIGLFCFEIKNYFWSAGKDSNLRSLRRQFYRLLALTACIPAGDLAGNQRFKLRWRGFGDLPVLSTVPFLVESGEGVEPPYEELQSSA